MEEIEGFYPAATIFGNGIPPLWTKSNWGTDLGGWAWVGLDVETGGENYT